MYLDRNTVVDYTLLKGPLCWASILYPAVQRSAMSCLPAIFVCHLPVMVDGMQHAVSDWMMQTIAGHVHCHQKPL